MGVDRWRDTTLGEVVNLKRGYDLPKRLRTNGPFPIVSSSGITGAHSEAKVDPPGVVTGRYGTLGAVWYVDEPYWPLNTTLYVQDFKGNDERFIAYLLESLDLGSLVSSAAVPGINRNHLHPLRVRVPDRSRQASIAAALGACDDLIENTRRRIEMLEETARLLYREWFVHFRYPGQEEVELIDSDLGPIPEGWGETRLAEACSLVMGQSPKSEYYNDLGEGLPFHQGVTDFGRRFPTHTKWTTLGNRVAEPGDILFSVRAPVGRINVAPDRLVVGRGLSAIRALDEHQNFLLMQLKDKFAVEDSIGGGTIFNAVTKKDMESIVLLKPTSFVVGEFEAVVSPMADLVANLSRQNAALRDARDLLLPRLISGEMDVSELDLGLVAV